MRRTTVKIILITVKELLCCTCVCVFLFSFFFNCIYYVSN